MSYIAKVEGQYYTVDGARDIKYYPYSLKFRLNSAEKPLSDIVRYLLKDALKKKYPASQGFVNHHLAYIHNETDPDDVMGIPILFLGYDQLRIFCKYRQLSYVEISESINLDILRVEVQLAADKGQTDYMKALELRKKAMGQADKVLLGAEVIEEDEERPVKTAEKPVPGTSGTSIGQIMDDDDDNDTAEDENSNMPDPVTPAPARRRTRSIKIKPELIPGTKPVNEFEL